MELVVNTKNTSYPIYIKQNILENIFSYIQHIDKEQKICVISDKTVSKLYGQQICKQLQRQYKVHVITINPGEKSKNIDTAVSIYEQLVKIHFTRNDVMIALGGGVVGDLVGFVAATYLRGVRFIQIPTTLLAQVDSSVGGKVAVDLPCGKNLIGAFYHPIMVLIDPCVLQTLPSHYFNDGMAEVIKYALIKDKSLFLKLEAYQDNKDLYKEIEEIIYRCLLIKKQIVEKDEFDQGTRMLLNFGHTIGHAIEQYYHYEKYTHGQAVAIGMYQITKISEAKGLTKKETTSQILGLLQKYQLDFKCNVDINELYKGIKRDKKCSGDKLSIITLNEIGNASIQKVEIKDFFRIGEEICD